MIKILRAGASTRLVDGIGEPRRAHLGVSLGGAADRHSLAHANSLVDNPLTATALEMTLLGATMGFEDPAQFALSGAPFTATLNDLPVAHHQASTPNAATSSASNLAPPASEPTAPFAADLCSTFIAH